MMKKIIALSMLLVSGLANATGEWQINAHGVAVSPYSESAGGFAVMMPDANIGFSTGINCIPSKYEDEEMPMVVSGVAVKMRSYCSEGNDRITWLAITETGNKHIVNEFFINKTVVVDGKVYSAKGFQKAVNILYIKTSGGI